MSNQTVPDFLKVKLLCVKDQYGEVNRHLHSSHGEIGSIVNLSYSKALDLIRNGEAEEVKP
jgi:hypothetical protein